METPEYRERCAKEIKYWKSRIYKHQEDESRFVVPVYPSPLYIDETYCTSEENDFHQELKEFVYHIERMDEEGKKFVRANEYPDSDSYNSYHSREEIQDLMYNSPVMTKLLNRISKSAQFYASQTRCSFLDNLLDITIWATIIRTHGDHAEHIHEDAIFSGTYYVDHAENTSYFELIDPLSRLRPQFTNDRIDMDSEYHCSDIQLQPEPGKMIMFPSYIPHKVSKNTTDQDRISFSFNISDPSSE